MDRFLHLNYQCNYSITHLILPVFWKLQSLSLFFFFLFSPSLFFILFFFFFFSSFSFFLFVIAAAVAHGITWTRYWIQATAAIYITAVAKLLPLTLYVGPGNQTRTSVGFLTHCTTAGTTYFGTFFPWIPFMESYNWYHWVIGSKGRDIK